jgi:regulator of RNase E activity RraA
VIVAVTGAPAFGYWGELMTRAAQARGLAGLVILGGVRDVDALEALGFPVFASAVCMRGTSKDPLCPGTLGEPVRLGEAVVSPGDLVVGDRDGVVALPMGCAGDRSADDRADEAPRRAAVTALAERARAREAAEERIREALAGGERLMNLLPIPEARSAPVDTRTRLARLDTSVLSDALDSLSLEGSVGGFQRWGRRSRIAGQAVTVTLEPGPAPPGGGHLGTRALGEARAGDVLVVANQGRLEAGSWGGLLTLGAQEAGVAGVVVDGALRDADEVDELAVAVFARASTPRTARGRFHEVATGAPVEVGGVTVEPGAWVVADGGGVVFIPAAEVARVIEVAEEMAAREAEMAIALRAGRRGAEVLDGRYEEMLRGGPR